MTNKEALIALCEEKSIDLEILTYKEIVEGYVCGTGINTVEDFCGYDMAEDDIAYWIVDTEPYFAFTKENEDISNEEIERILLFLDIEFDEFSKFKE